MKGESANLRSMPVRSCKVTVKDMEGVAHTVEVTAATLYDAVALGMAAIRGDEWVTGAEYRSTQGKGTIIRGIAYTHAKKGPPPAGPRGMG
jgi:hypothetical protein